MPTHNCETCSVKGNCPLEGIAPWLNEHEEEGMQAICSSAEELSVICTDLIVEAPILLMSKGTLVYGVEAAFLIGYHKGRTYQDIPDAFKEMDEPKKMEHKEEQFKIGDRVRVNNQAFFHAGEEGTITSIDGAHKTITDGSVVWSENFPSGNPEYGEHGIWFPNNWLELIKD